MGKDVYIDFHAVPQHHIAIHERLVNWGRWLNPPETPSVAPGFSLYRSSAQARGAESSWSAIGIDGGDAARINSLVQTLPVQIRAAIAWCYVKPINPRAAARDIGVTLDGLADLLREGRQRVLQQEHAAEERVAKALAISAELV